MHARGDVEAEDANLEARLFAVVQQQFTDGAVVCSYRRCEGCTPFLDLIFDATCITLVSRRQ
jgi:hypothetical protein